MKSLNFTRVNIKTYNTFLCIVFPLVAIAVLAENLPAFLNKLSISWLFSLEFLQGIAIFVCYSLPITYFLTKAYELANADTSATRSSSILGFAACSVLLLPLALVGLAMFAKISFFIPIAFTLGILFIYIRSLKLRLKPAQVRSR